jgi:hypothetical protein
VASNRGLCKTVVDGTVVPDMVTLSRKFSLNGTVHFQIKNREVGSKSMMDVVEENGVVHTMNVNDIDQKKMCLCDTETIHVARVVSSFEWIFGGAPQDVEWTFDHNDTFYILQSRPITSTFDLESLFGDARRVPSIPKLLATKIPKDEKDGQLNCDQPPQSSQTLWNDIWNALVQLDPPLAFSVSEFDTPATANQQWNTTYNIGEMLPGAVTPLTLSTFCRGLDLGLQDLYFISGGTCWPLRMPHCDRFVTTKVVVVADLS